LAANIAELSASKGPRKWAFFVVIDQLEKLPSAALKVALSRTILCGQRNFDAKK
jgi:hypothetical protein